MARKVLIAILFAVIQLAVSYKWYDQYHVIRAIPKTEKQLATLRLLNRRSHALELDFWREPTRLDKPVDIMFHHSKLETLTSQLAASKISWKVTIENVRDNIERSKAEFESRTIFKKGTTPFTIDQYHNSQEINDWIDSLATTYPSIASTFSIGKSHEGRDMRVIKIGAAGKNKKGFWIDATIHAREWITSGSINYIINELTTKYSTNPTYKSLVDQIDFYILPIVNPDGYEYTISDNRNWRKTRSGPYGILGCYGVDANRNWDNHWGGDGAGSNACSDTYDGPKVFSEIEVQNVANWMTANQKLLNGYVTLHSNGDYWMYPYSYAPKTYPPNVAQLKTISNDACAAIKKVNGTVYTIGSPSDVLYDASGNSMDWVVDSAHVPISFALELRPGAGDTVDDQRYGFDLPASYIIPVGTETWAGLQVVAQNLLTS